MSDNRNGLGVALGVVGVCVAVFAVVLFLLIGRGEQEGDPAVGFPIVMLVLIVVGVAGALGWRAVSRKRNH